MAHYSRNIYKTARETAGITQEKAAEQLFISTKCLRDYEAGERRPPESTVMAMIEIYGTMHLAIQHLQTAGEVGQTYMPEVEIQELPNAVLRLLKEINDFTRCHDDLLNITYDGEISSYEFPRWQEIKKELNDVISAALSVNFAR